MPVSQRSERVSRKRQKGEAPFRFQRKEVGLTWSCPKDREQPISSREHIRDVLTDKHGSNLHEIAREYHQNGEIHFHAWLKFDVVIDSEDVRLFDVSGVHPNILKGKPGPAWRKYLEKSDTQLLTNVEPCAFVQALAAPTVQQGMEILALRRPGDYLRFGESMERNLRRRIQTVPTAVEYYGPYVPAWFPDLWVPNTHSLLLWGPSGINKTQYAKWLMRHMVGDFDYVKGNYECVKRLSMRKPFIHDEVYCLEPTCKVSVSREITDVENGGEVECRSSNAYIPPGLPRIFISNLERPFRNPDRTVYGRRVYSFALNC